MSRFRLWRIHQSVLNLVFVLLMLTPILKCVIVKSVDSSTSVFVLWDPAFWPRTVPKKKKRQAGVPWRHQWETPSQENLTSLALFQKGCRAKSHIIADQSHSGTQSWTPGDEANGKEGRWYSGTAPNEGLGWGTTMNREDVVWKAQQGRHHDCSVTAVC